MLKKLVILSLVFTFSLAGLIELTYDEEKQVVINGITGFIIIDNKDVIQANTKTNLLLLKGLKPGEASIIVLTDKNKTAYKIKVKPQELVATAKSEVDYSGKRFISNISMGYGAGSSKSDYSQNVWDYGYTYYKFNTQGETPWGFLTNYTYFKNTAAAQGLNSFTTSLKNSYGLFTIGDQFYEEISSIVFPSQPLQGISYQGAYSNLDILLFYGRNNFGNWGSTAEREERDTQTLSFSRLGYRLNRDSSVGLNLSNFSSSLFYKTFIYLFDVNAEVGQDKNSRMARDFTLAYNNHLDLNAKLNYKDFAEGFELPFGMVDYRGFRGFNYNLNYFINNLTDLSYYGENYRRSINAQDLGTNKNNLVFNWRLEKSDNRLPDITVYYWDQRDESVTNSYSVVTAISPTASVTSNFINNYQYAQQGMYYQARKKIWLLDLWAKYSPIHYENVGNPAAGYDQKNYTYGFIVPVIKGLLSYQGEYTLEDNQLTTSSYQQDIYRSFIMLTPIPVYKTALFFNAFYQYDTRKNRSTDEVFSKHFAKLELIYYPNPDGNLTFGFYRTIDDAPVAFQVSRVLDEIRLEYSQNFNYLAQFGKGRAVLTGMVYLDDNANGQLDEAEKPVPNIRVKISDGQVSTTNQYGVYKFDNVYEGSTTIELEEGTQKLSATEDYPKFVQVQPGQRMVVNFGVLLANRIYGNVFRDDNQNGTKEEFEKGFSGVRIIIGETVIKTDEDGYYEYVTEGIGQEFPVELDLSSVPDGYKLSGERKTTVIGNGKVNFVLEKVNKSTYKDDYVEITGIKKLNKKELMVSGKILKPVQYAIINDRKFNIESGEFQVKVPVSGNKVKVKLYTRDRNYWIKFFSY
ncbi:MAG: SdrD B-like domain-containing protein [Candidatus Margulisbacteria bacterium]|nr:SdrD B-like domain-containing protein [Candidatus Margulisiibacteriota bacterium]